MSDSITKGEIVNLVVRVTALSAISYYTMKWLVEAMDPTKKQKAAAQNKARKLLNDLGIDEKLDLNEYELMIASHLVEPSKIPISWKDISGLEEVVQELRETVILPIQKRDLFVGSQLTQAPKGVLLHGPPGLYFKVELFIFVIFSLMLLFWEMLSVIKIAISFF